jgi:hypothetical protein
VRRERPDARLPAALEPRLTSADRRNRLPFSLLARAAAVRIPMLPIVADAGMVSEANHKDIEAINGTRRIAH